MGPTGPSARRAPYFFFFLAAFFFFAIVSPPPAPRVPRLARSFATLRGGRKKCQEENTLCGGNAVSGRYIWGATAYLREGQSYSRTEEGLRCSRRRTNS